MRFRAPHPLARAAHPWYKKLVIAHLRGRLLEKHANRVVVDAGGVG